MALSKKNIPEKISAKKFEKIFVGNLRHPEDRHFFGETFGIFRSKNDYFLLKNGENTSIIFSELDFEKTPKLHISKVFYKDANTVAELIFESEKSAKKFKLKVDENFKIEIEKFEN